MSNKLKFNIGAIIILVGIFFMTVGTEAASNNISGSVTQSYGADSSVLQSMLVEFKPKDKTSVVPVTSKDINNMLGVVVPLNNATIVLTPKNISSQQVLVASSGRYTVLVSNQNGSIKAGDYLTISSLAGIAMKADSNLSLMVGRAVDSYNGSNSIGNVAIKNSKGVNSNASIGRITADIQLAPNPLYLKKSNSVLSFLTKAEYDISNKTASPAKTYLSAIVFLATIIVTTVVLYTGTRAAIVAIGRNPLARSAIGRSLIKTITGGLIIFAVGMVAVYFILNH